MRKILITGGAGFVGAALAKALAAQGHTVHLMDKEGAKSTDAFLTQLLASDGVELHRYNMLEPGALANLSDDYTHIVHFAAILGVEKVLQHPYATLRDNALLLELALAFAKRNRSLERFVFASTSEVYAGSLEQGEMPIPTPEDTPLALPA